MVAKSLTVLAVLFFPLLVFAQAASLPASLPLTPLAYGDALSEIVALLGTLKGASALGIAAVIVQVVMRALRTPLADKLGKWRLTALLLLSAVGGLLAAKLVGASWGAAFVAGPVLASAQNFAHQLWTQFTEKPDTAPGAEH